MNKKITLSLWLVLCVGIMAFGAFYYFPHGRFVGVGSWTMACAYFLIFGVPLLGAFAAYSEYRRNAK